MIGHHKIKSILSDRRLILVSNREPYTHKRVRGVLRCYQTIGGLTSALGPVIRCSRGVWIAWGSGRSDFLVTDPDNRVQVPDDEPKYTLKRIRLSKREVSGYYRGFSNRVLWPISMSLLEKANIKPEYWRSYLRVNERFAMAALEEAEPEDMIWVHDFHLSLVPHFIKRNKHDSRVAFFWHTPWPPWEIFRALPWQKEILRGLLSSDLIGFHTRSYVENFVKCAKETLGASTNGSVVKMPWGHETHVKRFPVGIDYETFSGLSSSEKVVRRAASLRRRLRVKYLILGVDRLDYSKGIPNKLEAFGEFLRRYPRFLDRVVLLQIISPSRTRVPEYREIKEKIDGIVGRINGEFGRVGWVPIRYFYRSVSQEELSALYRAADVALITPLIGGMNLVSKEYIASKCEGNGALILSKFTGAAEELLEAILVNPHDQNELVEAIRLSLEMSPEERRRRANALRERVKEHDVFWWLKSFLEEWRDIYS